MGRQTASVLSHKYITRCAAPFRAGRRWASSPVPRHHFGLVGAPCPARKFAGGSSKVFMGQDTRMAWNLSGCRRVESVTSVGVPSMLRILAVLTLVVCTVGLGVR